jgi:hypothetical protein
MAVVVLALCGVDRVFDQVFTQLIEPFGVRLG